VPIRYVVNGTAPIPASSGQRQRYRLNRGGNRRLNQAIHMMALTQARMDPRARAYMARRLAEGRSRRDASRSLSATSQTSSTNSSDRTPAPRELSRR